MAPCHKFPPTPRGEIPGTVHARLLTLRMSARTTAGVAFEIDTDTGDETTWEDLSRIIQEEIVEQFYSGLSDGEVYRGTHGINWRAVLIQDAEDEEEF